MEQPSSTTDAIDVGTPEGCRLRVKRLVIPSFLYEREMREPVVAWLMRKGFLPAVEFWLTNAGITDIVAGAYAPRVGRRIPNLIEVVAIELKLRDVSGVIAQAKSNRCLCDWSYAAMPIERIQKMRGATTSKFADQGVGLLSVGDSITEVIAPRRGDGMPEGRSEVKQLWRRVRSLSG